MFEIAYFKFGTAFVEYAMDADLTATAVVAAIVIWDLAI
jgi:hypothetical protein